MERPRSPQTIDRIPAPTREAFERDYVARNLPVIITGVADGWNAVAKWNLDYIRRRCGDCRVPVRCYPSGYAGPHHEIEMCVAEYIDRMVADATTAEKVYLGEVDLFHHLPELAADVACPALFDRRHLNNAGLFFGLDSISPAHYHSLEEAILTQLHGHKRVLLYPPDQMANLYPNPWYRPMSNVSRVDMARPDTRAFPRLARADPISCTLAAGEMLFIPIHWWHYVVGVELSISLTFFWWAHWTRWTNWSAIRSVPRYGLLLPLRKLAWRLGAT